MGKRQLFAKWLWAILRNPLVTALSAAGFIGIVGILITNYYPTTEHVMRNLIWQAFLGLLALLILIRLIPTRFTILRPRQPESTLYINILDYELRKSPTEGYPPAKADTLWLRVYPHFNVPKPIQVESLELDLKGKRILAYDWESHPLAGFTAQYYYFRIPDSVDSGDHTAYLVASAGKEEWYSSAFTITLP